MEHNNKLFKVLTRNDTGETKSHQSGISIPKEVARSGIFPILNINDLNPRVKVVFFDETNKAWELQYIYYNDALFGKTKGKGHNEYRLTCVKKYIVENNIKAGDEIWFSIDENSVRHIGFKKQETNSDLNTIKLGNGWHYIKV